MSKSNQFSSFRNQLSMGVNVLFSLFAAFGMLYYVARHVMDFDETKVRPADDADDPSEFTDRRLLANVELDYRAVLCNCGFIG